MSRTFPANENNASFTNLGTDSEDRDVLVFLKPSMHKVYLLLRNNKQQGPYTLEELLQQSLKPLDLVWVEGKSAGWKYPAEIDALKDHVAEVQQQEKVKIETLVAPAVAIQLPPEQKKQGAKKKVYVSMPGGALPSMEVSEGESFSQKLEKKAEELYQRAQAYAKKKKDDVEPNAGSSRIEDTDLQTNYARSLDDIKQEYSSWLYDQKRNRKGSKRKMSLTVTATIIILVAGFTTAKFVFNKKSVQLASTETSEQPLATVQTTAHNSNLPEIANNNSKKNRNQFAKRSAGNAKNNTKTGSKARNTTLSANKNKDTVAQKPKPSSVLMNDLVKVSAQYAAGKNGIPDFIITVQNNSDEALRFVAVDLYYFQNDGSPAGKNTIYFNGIFPHQTIFQKFPGDKQANTVLKMRLMRSEEGQIYYANNRE